METDNQEVIGRSWKWLVVRGVIALLFGVLALARPGFTLATLVLAWGAYAIADGIFAVIVGVQMRGHGPPVWSWLSMGVLGIVAGSLTFVLPGVSALALLTALAVWAIGIGMLQIVAAVRLREVLEGEWALGFSGVLSVTFGVLAIKNPGAAALSVLWLIAGYTIAIGLALIVAGLRLKSSASGRLAHA